MEDRKALYENTFVPTEKDIGDYVVYQLKKRTPFSVLISSIVFISIFLIWWWLGSAGIINSPLAHLVVAVVLLGTTVTTDTLLKHADYHRLVRKFTSQNKEYLAGVRTLFYEDTVDANGEIYNYSDFVRVFYGESCMFLLTESKKLVMIKDSADAFGSEDNAAFWDFLNGKCTLMAPEKPSRSPFKFRSTL